MVLGKNGYDNNYFERNNNFFKAAGIWKLKRSKKIKFVLYYMYSSVLAILAFLYFIQETFVMKETSKDLFKLLNSIEMLFTHTIAFVKLYILVFKYDAIRRIMRLLELDVFKYKPLNKFQPAKLFNRQKEQTKIISTVMMVVYLFVGISSHISAIVDLHTTNYGETNDYLNRTCKDFLNYYGYMPYELKTTFACHFLFMMTDFQLGIFATYIALHDMTFASIINCLKTQFHILGGAIMTIRERTLDKLGLSTNYQIFRDTDNPTLEQELYKEISHCTKHLMVLIKIYDDVERMFTFVLLGQTLVSLLIFAACLYTSTSVPLMSPIFFSQLEYFCAVLVQFSIFCWYGNEVALCAEYIQKCLYECDWYSSSIRFKRALILNNMRMQRTLYISIGKFTPIQLATFISVIRASFSYFLVFRSIE